MAKAKLVTDISNKYFTNNKINIGTAAPTTGTYKAGDMVISSAANSTAFGWICTAAGTPGTWKVLQSGTDISSVSWGNVSGKPSTFAPTIGTTSTTAFRGDYGNTAYTHSQAAHAPTNAQKNSDITKAEIEAKLTGDVNLGSVRSPNLVTTNKGDGVSLLTFDTDRSWSFKQKGTAGMTELHLQSNTDTKTFRITDASGTRSISHHMSANAADLGINGGKLTVNTVNGNEAVKLVGSGSGSTNTVYLGLYEGNGTTRQGFIGIGSSSKSSMQVYSDSGNIELNSGSANAIIEAKKTIVVDSSVQIQNMNQSDANFSLNWNNNIARIRVGGNGSSAGNGFEIQGPGDNVLLKIENDKKLWTGRHYVTHSLAYDASKAPAHTSHIGIVSGNNGMGIGLNSETNSRSGWIQVGHESNSYPTTYGQLSLNPKGGIIYAGPGGINCAGHVGSQYMVIAGRKVSVGSSAPGSPATNDVWIQS